MGVLDWIYPKKCVGCGAYGRYICEECQRGIEAREGALKYTGVVRKTLKEIKYRGSYDMIRELIEVWESKCDQGRTSEKGMVVTSVPMWERKKRLRGFNQAELIARELARKWKLPYQELLVRVRETEPMYGLTREEREKNVRGAFAIRKSLRETRLVIIVDDVWTTGATMEECVRILKSQGSNKVDKVTLAR